MDYVVNINKPKGMTSHDVVYRVRRIAGTKKVGHTGTLDPDASGVLPICVNRATKAAELITASDKSYRAVMKLGITTDTGDSSGVILDERPVCVNFSDIENAVSQFTGEIEQIPPMYSAVKVNGERLYKLARAGITIERQSRKVSIHNIIIVDFDDLNKEVTLDVHCSKGTYIRTLCEDIGKVLGCGAHMAGLVRTASGRFKIEDSLTLEEFENACKANQLYSGVVTIDKLFDEYEAIKVNIAEEKKIRNGVAIKRDNLTEDETYRIYSDSGEFLCLSKAKSGILVMFKSFYGGV